MYVYNVDVCIMPCVSAYTCRVRGYHVFVYVCVHVGYTAGMCECRYACSNVGKYVCTYACSITSVCMRLRKVCLCSESRKPRGENSMRSLQNISIYMHVSRRDEEGTPVMHTPMIRDDVSYASIVY
jgi:hypothetical protein